MSSLLNPPLPDGDRRRLRWHQLYGSAAALALAEATRADRRLYVVIADSVHELERLTAELRFFADGALPLLRLPDWEVLPYELFSPHPDTISERLKTLFELPQLNDGCLIVSADALQHLSRRERGAGAGGDRVLPAAVLRFDGDALRLPAAGRGDRAGRGAAGDPRQGMAGRRGAPRGPPPRHRTPGAFARGVVSSARRARGGPRCLRIDHPRRLQGRDRALGRRRRGA